MSGNIIGALEIGTSKTVALVGEIEGERSINIIGVGQCDSSGVRRAEIQDRHEAAESVHAALSAAERNAGAAVQQIYLAASGAHLAGFSNPGLTSVTGADDRVTVDDVNRAAAVARSKALLPGRVYVHHIRCGAFIDGEAVKHPVAKSGKRLELSYWHVHGAEERINDALTIVKAYDMWVKDIILSSVASGSILTGGPEKESGVLVMDIGAGVSDYVLYREGFALRTGVIPIGGDHFSNDLSVGLRINYGDAENLKLRHGGGALSRTEEREHVLLVGDLTIGDRPLPTASIRKILELRAEELFRILKNTLGSAISAKNLPGGVILTGGASRMEGLTEVAEETLGVPVRAMRNPEWVTQEQLREPEYSTVLGLLYFGLLDQMEGAARPPGPDPQPWINKVRRLFR